MLVNYRGPEFCSDLTATPTGREHVLRAWGWLDGVARDILSAVYMQHVPKYIEPSVHDACRHLITEVYIMVLLIGVSYLLWLDENKSRVLFMERAMGKGHWAPVNASRLTHHAVLTLAFFAISWRASSWAFLRQITARPDAL